MTKQVINTGLVPNSKSGDPLRVAFEKINNNFTELYAVAFGGIDLTEVTQDYAAQLFIDGDHDGVTVTYDDEQNKINITINDIDGGGA